MITNIPLRLRDELDEIAEGKMEYIPFMDSQYKPLLEEIAKAEKEVDKESVVILGKDKKEKCPECGVVW